VGSQWYVGFNVDQLGSNNLMENFEVMIHIQDDLIVRGVTFDGDLDELHILLIERLWMEHDLNDLKDDILACAKPVFLTFGNENGVENINRDFGRRSRQLHGHIYE
jgi:hypothetical protein